MDEAPEQEPGDAGRRDAAPGGPATGSDAGGGDDGSGRVWPRAAGLFLLTMALSAVEPMVLVGVPYVFLLLAIPTRRMPGLILGGLAAVLAFGGPFREGLWYAERGWAVLLGGWFVALTLRFPASRFTSRGLGAVGGAGTVVAALFLLDPERAAVLDWLVSERMRAGVTTALDAIRLVRGEEGGGVPAALVDTVYRTAEMQAEVFPALLGLASLAGLGVSWWLYLRFARGRDEGLRPVKEFRFNDQLVWLFVGGLALLLAGGEGLLGRTGSNAVVFMGALYALRGAAVVVFFNGGVSFFGFVLLALGLLFVAPVILVGALVIGLGDTWLDLRRRAREAVA